MTYETVVRAVFGLWGESHCRVIGATGVVGCIVRAGSVPSETDQDRSEGSVCHQWSVTSRKNSEQDKARLTIVSLELHLLGDLVVNLLVLLLTPPQAGLPLDGGGDPTSGRAELLDPLFGCGIRAKEVVGGSEGGDTCST